jgi:hypothetical protein
MQERKLKTMKSRTWLFALICSAVIASAHGQQSNTVVVITGPQESNVVTTIERFDHDTNQTNITTKTKYYEAGHLIEDRTERKGPIDLTAVRVYQDGHLIMFQSWDSKSQTMQRTYLRDDKAVVTEVSTGSAATPDLIIFHGKEEEIVSALKRDNAEELKVLNHAALVEMQEGAKIGTEFMNNFTNKVGVKKQPK